MIRGGSRVGLGPVVVGLYAWLTAVSFGAVLLDILYARLAPEAAVALNEAADFLLLINGAVLIASLGAIALSWNHRRARMLIIASLLVVVAEFLAVALLSPILRGAGPGSGAGIRIILSGLTSLLAFAGAFSYFRGD